MRGMTFIIAVVAAWAALVAAASATPQFTREYKLPCSSCHAHVPKLNSFGEQFLADGYLIPGQKKARTIPVAVWASVLSQNLANDADRFKTIPNRIELVSAGRSESARMSYFAEWRVLSREFLGDGSVRDRSGRFEDLFALFDLDQGIQIQVGQFRALSQIDVSRRLNLAEPVVFSTSLAGASHPDPRIQSLRGFAPSGRSPSVRLAMTREGWTGVATVPFPGEFSIPLTSQAETTASFELEGKPKGVFLEAYRRDGVNSMGLHGFVGGGDRNLLGFAAQHQVGNVWFEGGIARAEVASVREWRYSVGFDWIPMEMLAAGLRVDQRQIAGQKALFLPYVSFLQPIGDQLAKLAFEGRIQDGRTPRWLVELSFVF